MIVTVTPEAPTTTTASLLATAASLGLSARSLPDDRGGAVVGIDGSLPPDALTLPGIEQIHTRHRPYMLASNEHPDRSVVRVRPVAIGDRHPGSMAGPPRPPHTAPRPP